MFGGVLGSALWTGGDGTHSTGNRRRLSAQNQTSSCHYESQLLYTAVSCGLSCAALCVILSVLWTSYMATLQYWHAIVEDWVSSWLVHSSKLWVSAQTVVENVQLDWRGVMKWERCHYCSQSLSHVSARRYTSFGEYCCRRCWLRHHHGVSSDHHWVVLVDTNWQCDPQSAIGCWLWHYNNQFRTKSLLLLV